ncbi:hypothetical protein EXE41_10100 [Halorubrum sp. SD690R]|uniref:hypothetical protein n=1 Tax=Halorubrum sp. SD690R TaxID=2518117 RepID=UPI0010F84D6A|nr:hypothetical protein [Halorubrum sp. SD690R]TKX46353.1 hypothetical protein EXE41_10100 [Halorubrum sp. SD690R]
MDIDLPSDNNRPENDSVFGGRIDLYEAYWLYVDGVRYVGPVLKQSEATKDDEDRSPLARHYNHFYEKKEEHKKKCRDLPKGLRKYKQHFEEPRGNVVKVPRDRLNDLGINWEEGDDPIWLPPEYELPAVWENGLENMGQSELRELVRKLRSENDELRDQRDELKEKLAEVRRSLSVYLDKEQRNEKEDAITDSVVTCEDCGATFENKAGLHGHKSHCDATESTVDAGDLEQLAEELPELSDHQSSEGHGNATPEEELENLNHLLKGSL